jgi:hypothetical protein
LQYSLKKNRVHHGFIGEKWEQRIVSELDSALNKWVDSVPDHREFKVFSFLHILNIFPPPPSPLGSPPRASPVL